MNLISIRFWHLLRKTMSLWSPHSRSVAGRSTMRRLFILMNQRRICWHSIPLQAREIATTQGKIRVFQPFSSSRSFILISSTEVVFLQTFLCWCLGLPLTSISAAVKMTLLTWNNSRVSFHRRWPRPSNRLRLEFELGAGCFDWLSESRLYHQFKSIATLYFQADSLRVHMRTLDCIGIIHY